MFVKCVTSPIGTSGTRRGGAPRRRGATMRIRNPEGPSRSLIHSCYVGMTFLASKETTSWGPRDPSSTRLCQSTTGWHALHAIQPPYHQLRAAQRIQCQSSQCTMARANCLTILCTLGNSWPLTWGMMHWYARYFRPAYIAWLYHGSTVSHQIPWTCSRISRKPLWATTCVLPTKSRT